MTGRREDIDGSGDTLAFADEFDGDVLDETRWLPHYLPHWSERERTVPRYSLADSCLVLRIDPDQQEWCPEFDAGIKVSNVQTGQWSGPLASPYGQHRFSPDLRVRQEQEHKQLFLTRFGRFEIKARADISANNLVALWLIGLEDEPHRSGELCVLEIKGWELGDGTTLLGYGVKPWSDPSLTPDFHEDRLAFDVSDFHVYRLDWTADGIEVFLDGRLLRRIAQSPAYPMQMMLNIYELPNIASPARATPASFFIDYIRVWTRAEAHPQS